jgi:hypothetical protein
MELNQRNCSLKTHQENDAILFCYDCKIYMCNKCAKHHNEIFPEHQEYKLDNKNIKDIFIGLCEENGHLYELKYFCKNHNKLCCAECITKFKGKNHGQHSDCEVCSIEDIKEEKKNKLKNNINKLEELSNNLKQSIEEIKLIFEKIQKDKEEIKLEIQKVFTKLRYSINDREDELLLNVDKLFQENFNEDIFNKIEKLPNKMKKSLDKGKLIENNWNNNDKLNSLINDCLNIENNINKINNINEGIEKFNINQGKILFIRNENEFIEKIKIFGVVIEKSFSDIINIDDFKKINKWIGKNNKYILKYSAKKDGCNTDIFHQKCDNIEGSIIICKVDQGDIIGGYISTKIQKKDGFSDDDKAFVFNLSKNIVKRNKKNTKNAIKNFNNSSYFIRFGSSCDILTLSGNCLNNSESHSKYYSCNGANFDCDEYDIFNNETGDKYFKVENFEVFQVL